MSDPLVDVLRAAQAEAGHAQAMLSEQIRVCPACGAQWQMTDEVAMQWVTITLREDGSALSKMLGGLPSVDLQGLHEMWESVFREHVGRECTSPRLILEMLKGAGG